MGNEKQGNETATLGTMTQVVRLQMTSTTSTIQFKPVTSLASNNSALVHYEQSAGYNQIS